MEERSEFGEMDITSAFQAEFVSSNLTVRKAKKKVFRGVIEHVKKEMAFNTAISQDKDHDDKKIRRQGILDSIPCESIRKKVIELAMPAKEHRELKHLSTDKRNQQRDRK
jgi:hypothetical protein